jgi:hypothetical protein
MTGDFVSIHPQSSGVLWLSSLEELLRWRGLALLPQPQLEIVQP